MALGMAKNSKSRVLLMLSGRTEWDILGRVQGSADLPMSAAGEWLAREQAAAISGQTLNAIAVAPDEASRATGRILAAATGVKQVTAVPELAEMALGLWEGLRYDELEQRYCAAGRQFLEDPSGVTAPDGEHVSSHAARVQGAFERVVDRSKPGAAIGVVVRPIALGLLRCFLNGAEVRHLWAMLKDRPDVEWYDVVRNDPRLVVTPRRSRRPASAA